MDRSLRAVLFGTFTLRFSTGLTGAMLVYYLAELPRHGGPAVSPVALGALTAAFFAAELLLSPPFGALADRLGHHRVMQWGPLFGAVAVVLTWATTNLLLLGGTRLLEGASTAASVPSILGYVALVTAGDVALRGRAAARFEGATLAGLGIGLVVAGPLYEAVGRTAFLLNALVYGLSYLVYRHGVAEPAVETPLNAPTHYGLRRYLAVLLSSHVWLLAPTWIAINAALGIATGQTVFQLVKAPDPRFADQLLMGRASPSLVSLGLGVALVVFFAGLFYWGNRFRALRRTTIIFHGILGGGAIVLAAGVLNHSQGLPPLLQLTSAVVLVAGVFVLAGATPAALGLLADISEAFPADRGVIMGLYSVFLALGQIGGNLLGGAAAEARGIDGLLLATFLLLVVALVPLARLRAFEHVVGTEAPARRGSEAVRPPETGRPPGTSPTDR